MALAAPNMYQEYFDSLDQLLAFKPSLRPLFRNSVYAAASWNFGPNACTVSHVDSCNRAIGWCSIFVLGDFDPTESALLVLEQLRLVIRFPPGSTINIPSALFRHGNTALKDGETRMVMTQYSSGGIYRFVEHGFHLISELRQSNQDLARTLDSPEYKKARKERQVHLFSKVKDLHADRVRCGLVRFPRRQK